MIGGSSIVEEFLRRLPNTPADIQYEPEELEGYAQRISQMSDPPSDLLTRQLTATQWWNRIIALLFFNGLSLLTAVGFLASVFGGRRQSSTVYQPPQGAQAAMPANQTAMRPTPHAQPAAFGARPSATFGKR